ncbi:MAG TPA: FHA domain-containing protein [Burkholderiales bacterium]
MPKLIIKLNDEVIDHVELRQGDMKIGRKPGCEIVLDNLAVSGEHANVFTIGEDSFIQDLNSTNGTFVNNKRVLKHHLRNGDAIGIGQYSLLYLRESARPVARRSHDDFAKTVVINPSAMAETAGRRHEAPEAPSVPNEQPPATLYVLNGRTNGRRIELRKAVTNLGKTGRPAGVILRTAEGYVLRPANESEKPKVNGRVIPLSGARLRNGDIIEVAGTRLQFSLK